MPRGMVSPTPPTPINHFIFQRHHNQAPGGSSRNTTAAPSRPTNVAAGAAAQRRGGSTFTVTIRRRHVYGGVVIRLPRATTTINIVVRNCIIMGGIHLPNPDGSLQAVNYEASDSTVAGHAQPDAEYSSRGVNQHDALVLEGDDDEYLSSSSSSASSPDEEMLGVTSDVPSRGPATLTGLSFPIRGTGREEERGGAMERGGDGGGDVEMGEVEEVVDDDDDIYGDNDEDDDDNEEKGVEEEGNAPGGSRQGGGEEAPRPQTLPGLGNLPNTPFPGFGNHR